MPMLACSSRSRRILLHAALLAGVSAAALLAAIPRTYARDILNRGSVTAPVAAATAQQAAAMQAAQQAARQANNSLARTTRALQAMQAAQSAARNLALQTPGTIPNGLAPGGLVVAPGAGTTPGVWTGARLPTQAQVDGRIQVDIKQTESKAILNWTTFNVGKETTVRFDQGGNSNWVALNRVTDPSARPSQIAGQIKADGGVYILNRNGIIFTGSSQVNVGALVASTADIPDLRFRTTGIYSSETDGIPGPSFTGAGGMVKVEAGALIATPAPASVTAGGGFVMLLGQQVENAGAISTPKGQTMLAAGDSFFIRKGYATDANKNSTTRGNEVAPVIAEGSPAGTVRNSGLIYSQQGDITLTGRSVAQDGIALSTTSVNTRGTIHLLNAFSDIAGSVTLGENSVTAILPELETGDTALDSQRDALIAASIVNQLAGDAFNNLSRLTDRKDQSRVEIVTGGDVHFRAGSLTLAQGGQISVQAARRMQTEAGAVLDVSGVRGVLVPMSANNVLVDIQGNELRDAPVNREQSQLKNADVWIDVRDLILVPAGTGGYATNRYYTKGGLLEVGGYLANTAHKLGEWVAVGGTITLTAGEVVAKPGSLFDVSGGSVQYEGGWIKSSALLGIDGRVYDIGSAPADMLFVGMGEGFVRRHARWGVTEVFMNPFGRGKVTLRHEEGYTVGRDAGRLILSAPTSLFEGNIVADVVVGARQNEARPDSITDGYKAAQYAAPRAGILTLDSYLPGVPVFNSEVRFASKPGAAADGLGLTDTIPEARVNTAWFDADALSAAGLGGIEVQTINKITVDAPLAVVPGGSVKLAGAIVDLNADITARSGTVIATNRVSHQGAEDGPTIDGKSAVTLAARVTIDVRGLWVNALLDRDNLSGLAHLDGGSVTLEASGTTTLAKGSVVDVSSGGAILADGKTRGGYGGNITLGAGQQMGGGHYAATDPLILDGTLRGHGVAGGGTLTINAAQAIIISDRRVLADGVLPAGMLAPTGLALVSDLQVRAGGAVPFDRNFTFTRLVSGLTLPNYASPTVSDADPLRTQADWTVPGDLFVLADGNFYSGGMVVPAGSNITFLPALAPNFAVPADVFPTGIPITPIAVPLAAGTIVPIDLVIPAGTLVPAGAALTHDITVRPPFNIGPDFFDKGFANYALNAKGGVLVTQNTRVDVSMPALRFSAASYGAATGSDPQAALERWLPPLYTENATARRITQRGGANLSLSATNPAGVPAAVEIARGAILRVDPGRIVSVLASGQITVDGAIEAPGGKIVLTNVSQENFHVPGRSIWLGSESRLDVAGRAVVAHDLQGRPYGMVPDGGTIAVGGEVGDLDIAFGSGSHAFVVIRPGAVLDASGTSAVLDLAAAGPNGPSRPATVASKGGSIVLTSKSGIHAEGTMRAQSGGAGVAGGTLLFVLDAPVAYRDAPDSDSKVRVLTVAQAPGQSPLPADLAPGEADPGLVLGEARVSADQIMAGGFDDVTLFARDAIAFDGSVSLRAGSRIRLMKGVLSSVGAQGSVTISAPHIEIAGWTHLWPEDPGNSYFRRLFTSAQESSARFTVEADLIDVKDDVWFGASSGSTDTGPPAVDFAGFAEVNLASRGDIRFHGHRYFKSDGSYVPENGLVYTRGNITLAAAQVYPVTGGRVSIRAGYVHEGANVPETYVPGSTIAIRGIGGAVPETPYAVFGSIGFYADRIEQGGIVRAPLGGIAMGLTYPPESATSAVILLPGSITSVSAAGLILPYGGTADGVTYSYAGGAVTFPLSELNSSINLAGKEIVIGKDAVLDMTGGGTLTGAGFVSGRGGSVDVLRTSLGNANPVNRSAATGGGVYAIVPSSDAIYAPVDAGAGAQPAVGSRITIPAGVPGLPAGTYTLMPASYALLPGAFRVELGGSTVLPPAGAVALPNGSYVVGAMSGIANTSIGEAQARLVTVTPGAALRLYSQYNEQGYAAFALARAATLSQPRPALPVDGHGLMLTIVPSEAATPLRNEGISLFQPAEGGRGGTAIFMSGNGAIFGGQIEVYGNAPTPGFDGVSIAAADLTRFNASRLSIGGYGYIGGGNGASPSIFNFISTGSASSVIVRDGAFVAAPEIFLVALGNGYGGTVTIEAGATLDTRGRGAAPYDSTDGIIYGGGNAVVFLSEGWLNVQSSGSQGGQQGGISIGTCPSGACTGRAQLLSNGSLAFSTSSNINLTENAVYGARYLTLSGARFDIGSEQALASANRLEGQRIDQATLDRLIRGSGGSGLPRLERLVLSAGRSINFYGTVDLNTIDPATGRSVLDQFVLSTPAIYGYGDAGDRATITTSTLIWNGMVGNNAGPIVAGGAGTGAGTLDIRAERIVFGYSETEQRPQRLQSLERLLVGFSTVTLVATDRITANADGALAVYRSQGAYVQGSGFSYSGGDLNIVTPLLTGEAGSITRITAGGALTIRAPEGAVGAATTANLGAEIRLSGGSVLLDTVVGLPSGRLTMTAQGDLVLGANARLDLAGREVVLLDRKIDSWGGDVVLTSIGGSIVQHAGAVIDVSASNNDAGSVSVTALGTQAGHVDLAGTILGRSTGSHDVGGTVVPYDAGGIDIRARTIADFAGLNRRLTETDVTGTRTFVLRNGDLTIGDEIKARNVTVSVDGGRLTVNGRIDASGAQVGSIRLAARDDLVIGANAVLDAHGTVLRIDSYGKPIDAPNRAIVELTTARGTLVLQPGARFDLRSADSIARGTIELNAPRVGANDIAISAAGALDIQGARSVAVNGFRRYDDAPVGPPSPGSAANQIIDQAYLDRIHADSRAFIDAAGANTDLQGRLRGLKALGDTFHLRPGVEIVSATPGGDLTVLGDVDFAGYRYGPKADPARIGSGEPGALVIRAGGNLNIYGSITDGFGRPIDTGQENGWVLYPDSGNPAVLEPGETRRNTLIPVPAILAEGSKLRGTLNFDVWLASEYPESPLDIPAGGVLPTEITLSREFVVPAGGMAATATIHATDGRTYEAGQIIPAGTVLPVGTRLAAGNVMPDTIYFDTVLWPSGAPLDLGYASAVVARDTLLPAGAIIPDGSNIKGFVSYDSNGERVVSYRINTRPSNPESGQGRIWPAAPMLAEGTLSWSMRLVAGADLGSADTRQVRPAAQRGEAKTGNIVLSDLHYTIYHVSVDPYGPNGWVCNYDPAECANVFEDIVSDSFNVIRTGTGDLELLAANDFTQRSAFGIYTAGTQLTVDADHQRPRGYNGGISPYIPPSDYKAYFPTGGGNLLVSVGGDLKGWSSGAIGDWLWRQGGSVVDVKAAWWINFGAYSVPLQSTGERWGESVIPVLLGFAGMGTLGGGNVTVVAGGNAGVTALGIDDTANLNIAVGSTGRVTSINQTDGIVTGGTLEIAGGGDLILRVAGSLSASGSGYYSTATNLRGAIDVKAGSVGAIDRSYGFGGGALDPRTPDPLQVNGGRPSGGLLAVPGDAAVRVSALRDLVFVGTRDPGRVPVQNDVPFTFVRSDGSVAQSVGSGVSWFTLWTASTTVDLLSAGGGLTPAAAYVQYDRVAAPVLRAVAANGSIFMDENVELAPSPMGQLELLARQSIYGNRDNSNVISMSGAAVGPDALPNPFKPAFRGRVLDETGTWTGETVSNVRPQAAEWLTLFTFEADTVTGNLHANDPEPMRFYAVEGDIVAFRTGSGSIDLNIPSDLQEFTYIGAKPIRMIAGRDIVGSGIGETYNGPIPRNLVVHGRPTDISVISAGRDIIYLGLEIAGPGLLQVSAGRNIYQGNLGYLHSIGPIVDVSAATRSGGAGITMMAGMGAGGPNYDAFARLYLDPANLADAARPLADQPGKAVKIYDKELLAWLKERFGYEGGPDAALAYFLGLPSDQQGIFLRRVYYDELRDSGREYNDPDSRRYSSYLRGRQAVALLFPDKDAAGQAITYKGDITMFGGAGVRTDFGGDVQVLAPGGQVLVGVEGQVPPATAGLVTQGSGDVQVYSKGSVLLGLSRIMTTFGGDIVIWSAEGDINAGRGSKTTVIYTPPRRVYDIYGNVTLSPEVPSNGAGIATLNPIAEVARGDVDLIAPLGTIDVGEAGIRVSGNVNLAALQVINAGNIQVQGVATGIPTAPPPNVSGALTASSAAGAAAQAAKQPQQSRSQQELPSIITVEVLGYGGGGSGGGEAPPRRDDERRKGGDQQGYNPNSAVQYVGAGPLTDEQRTRLAEEGRLP